MDPLFLMGKQRPKSLFKFPPFNFSVQIIRDMKELYMIISLYEYYILT